MSTRPWQSIPPLQGSTSRSLSREQGPSRIDPARVRSPATTHLRAPSGWGAPLRADAGTLVATKDTTSATLHPPLRSIVRERWLLASLASESVIGNAETD
jgi:hypothetical protein